MGTAANVAIIEGEASRTLDLKAKVENLGYGVIVLGAIPSDACAAAELRAGAADIALVGVAPENDFQGIETAKALRSRMDIPIIHLCPYMDEEMLRRTSQAEPYGRLVGPVHEGALYSAIELALHQHRASSERRNSDARLQAEAIREGEGVFVADARTGRIIEASPATLDLLGYGEEELLALEVEDILADGGGFWNGNASREEAFKAAIGGGLRHKNGSTIHVGASAITIHYMGGSALCIVHRCTSPTEDGSWVDARQLHSDGMQRLCRTAGSVSHCFNGIIQTILGNAELIEADNLDNVHVEQEVAEIIKACHKATGITRQLLAYVGHIPLRLAEVNLSELVAQMAPRLRSMASGKAAIQLRLAEGLPLIQADTERVRLILENIFVNSLEAIEDIGGKISITTTAMAAPPVDPSMFLPLSGSAKGGFVVFEVRDNGCGMKNETMVRIFDPFFTTKFVGRGLGLSSVFGAVRQHNGFLGVSSTLGAGSRVAVGLPVSERPGRGVEPHGRH
ncbi:MAG: ATP-binding protein [Syntrophobacteraceae bacterium]